VFLNLKSMDNVSMESWLMFFFLGKRRKNKMESIVSERSKAILCLDD